MDNPAHFFASSIIGPFPPLFTACGQGENVVAVNEDNVLSLMPKDLIGCGKGEGEDKGGGGSAK